MLTLFIVMSLTLFSWDRGIDPTRGFIPVPLEIVTIITLQVQRI